MSHFAEGAILLEVFDEDRTRGGVLKYRVMQSDNCLAEKLMLPKKYSRRIFYSGMLSIISVAVSLYFGLYDFTIIATVVLVNSINYWRHPVTGWRRNIDMICAIGACLYQMIVSFGLESQGYFMSYWITGFLAIFSYRMARRYGRISRNLDMASRWHMGLHIMGNASNVILYYGFSLQQ
jgi:hypothetical protein